MSAINQKLMLPLLAAVVFGTEPALSVPITVPYNVAHTYRIRLVGNQEVRGAFDWNLQARANPPAVNASNVGNVGPVIPPSAITRNANANLAAPIASADANCDFSLPAPDATGLITGSHRAHGRATLDVAAGGRFAAASSLCQTGINRGTTDARGNIQWNPQWSISSLFAGAGLRVRDPINFSVFDLDTGITRQSELLSIALDMAGPGSATWDDSGHVDISGIDGSFSVILESPFITSGTGSLMVEFADGLITLAEDSGIFDGMLPSVGSASQFGLDFPADFSIDFDFGPTNVAGYVFDITLGAAAAVSLVPEPSTIGLLLASALAWRFGRRQA